MRLGVVVCALSAATAAYAQAPSSELERAAEEFRSITREFGLRGDSPRRARQGASQRAGFHGRLFENFRNDILDAVPHEIVQRGGDKSLLRRNQFGFNLSGPVVIPKLYNGGRNTFFSASYEGVREGIGRSWLRTVPILGQRDGDFSEVVDAAGVLLPVYDPASTRPNPKYNPSQPVSETNLQYLRDTFPDNRVPVARQDPVARKMLGYYPLPNANAGPFWRNNYFIVSPETNTANGMIFKVDHTLFDKHRLAGTYAFTNGTAGTARYIQNAADSAAPDRTYVNRRGSLEHVYTISPQTVNTATAEIYHENSQTTSDTGNFSAEFGLKGVDARVFPSLRLGSYLPMGRVTPASTNSRNTFVYTDAASLKRGRHNLRLVGQFIRQQVNVYIPAYPAGMFQFRSYLTSLPGIVNTGDGFASFLLGLADLSEVSLIPSPSYFRNSRFATAVQDTWEIRPNFTVSFGLRMEWTGPRSEKYGRFSTVDLKRINPANGRPGALAFAGLDGYGDAFQPWVWRPEPNISMSWNPESGRKSVVRASYGMSKPAPPVYSNHWGTQGYNGYATYISQNVQLEPAVTLSGGVPAWHPLPDLRPDAANGTWADLVEPSAKLPTYQSAGASYERELPGTVTVTASVGTAWGHHLYVGNGAANVNAIPPDNLKYRDALNNESFRGSLRPYPQYLGFDIFNLWPAGNYRRNAASFRAEKRTSQGLSLNATYELSRQWDDYSGPYAKQDQFNARNEWSLSAWNAPQRFSLSFMYELPIGAGKPYLAYKDWRRYIVNGWSVSGITTASSGEPMALRSMFNNTGGVLDFVRVSTVPGVDPHVASPGPDGWYNPAAFSHPDDFSMGNGPRTHPSLRNPGNYNHDLSISKRFALDQNRSVELNASGFNWLNNAMWNDPDTAIGTADAPNLNAGKIIGSRGGRVIQIGLRLSF
jgi:hypothetical protein